MTNHPLEELRLQAQPARREALKARIHARAADVLKHQTGVHSNSLDTRDPPPPARSNRRWVASFLSVAAAILVALLWRPVSSGMLDLLGGALPEYVTAPGERAQLKLADGTEVTLGANSRLTVLSDLSGPERQLQLEGFALLNVAHDAGRPFIVHTRTTTTRVLGTTFVIRAYDDEETIAIAVAEGRVAVVPDAAMTRSGVFLNPGQVGRLSQDGLFEVKQDQAEVGRLVRSAHGPLRYSDARLSTVLEEMEHLYSVELAIADSSLGEQLLTLRLPADELTDVLNAIALAVGARYERVENTITFYPGGRTPE